VRAFASTCERPATIASPLLQPVFDSSSCSFAFFAKTERIAAHCFVSISRK
jgi:hypothetical protein